MDSGVLRIHTDGASRGNPGDAAFGYVIHRDEGPTIEEAGCLGRMTNNQAEYTALVRALEHAARLGTHHGLLIHSDSELMVKQLNGQYRVKDMGLKGLYERAKELCSQFQGSITIRHVRRGHNSQADALCNQALDGTWISATPPDLAEVQEESAPEPPKEDAPSASSLTDKGTQGPPDPLESPSLEAEAIACLERAAEAWYQGDRAPAPATLWGELTALMTRHGIKGLTKSSGKRQTRKK